MGIMEEVSEHGKGWLKDGRHSWVKEGLSRFLSSFFPLRSLADMSKAPPDMSAMSEHQNLFHCDITDVMACEITMSEAEGADLLREALAGAIAPYEAGKQTHLSSLDNTVKPAQDSAPPGRKLIQTDHPEAVPKMHGTIPLQFY